MKTIYDLIDGKDVVINIEDELAEIIKWMCSLENIDEHIMYLVNDVYLTRAYIDLLNIDSVIDFTKDMKIKENINIIFENIGYVKSSNEKEFDDTITTIYIYNSISGHYVSKIYCYSNDINCSENSSVNKTSDDVCRITYGLRSKNHPTKRYLSIYP